MPVLYRSFGDRMAPPMYFSTPQGVLILGHWPIPVTISRIGCGWISGEAAAGSFQPVLDGINVGDAIVVPSGGHVVRELDTPIAVPAVAEGNVDGASRFGIRTPVPSSFSLPIKSCTVALAYSTADGRVAYGLGGDTDTFVNSLANGRFGAPCWMRGRGRVVTTPGDEGYVGLCFPAPYELPGAGLEPVAAVPMARHGFFSDFTIVCTEGPPGGVYRFNLRLNGATVFSIETANTSQRVYVDPTDVPVEAGAFVAWQLEVVSGSGMPGELLWTFRASDSGERERGWMADPPGAFGGPYTG